MQIEPDARVTAPLCQSLSVIAFRGRIRSERRLFVVDQVPFITIRCTHIIYSVSPRPRTGTAMWRDHAETWSALLKIGGLIHCPGSRKSISPPDNCVFVKSQRRKAWISNLTRALTQRSPGGTPSGATLLYEGVLVGCGLERLHLGFWVCDRVGRDGESGRGDCLCFEEGARGRADWR